MELFSSSNRKPLLLFSYNLVKSLQRVSNWCLQNEKTKSYSGYIGFKSKL